MCSLERVTRFGRDEGSATKAPKKEEKGRGENEEDETGLRRENRESTLFLGHSGQLTYL